MIGCGIALVPKRFVVGELSDGSLVKAMPFEMISQNAYYMAYQNRLAHTPKVEAMINWITRYLANQEKTHNIPRFFACPVCQIDPKYPKDNVNWQERL